MMILARILIYGMPESLLLSAGILTLLWHNLRLLLQDYPKDVRAAVPPKTAAERRQSAYWAGVFLLLLIVFPLLAALSAKAAQQADVLDAQQVAHLIAATVERYGRIDILVNNAASMLPSLHFLPLLEMKWEDFLPPVAAELKAAFALTKAVVPTMIEQRSARLIYLASVRAKLPYLTWSLLSPQAVRTVWQKRPGAGVKLGRVRRPQGMRRS